MNYSDEEDEKRSSQETVKAEARLEAIRVEINQAFFDLANLIDESYDELERPFVCQYCDEIIINKPQVVPWGGSFYHLEKCVVKAARERLSL